MPTPTPSCTLTPDFTFTSTGGNNPTINFFGSYTGAPAPTTYSWDFTNNGTTDTTGQNVSNHYTGNPSNVFAKLTVVSGSCGPFSIVKKVIN